MKTTIAQCIQHSHVTDSYNLNEEIAVRAVFRTIRPDYLADHFNSAFYELSGDVYAQARLVDIGLRFEKNLALNLAAARKIRVLLDEHKILMIPAYIEVTAPEISTVIASAIPTIRNPDPRRYFLERWMHHEHPAVARICREALAGMPEERATIYEERPGAKLARPAERPALRMAERPALRMAERPALRMAERPALRTAERPAVRPRAQQTVHMEERPKVRSTARPNALMDVSSGEEKKATANKRAMSASGSKTSPDIPASFAAGARSGSGKKTAAPKKIPPSLSPKTRTAAPEREHRTVSPAEADSFGYEKLITLIGRHIGDSRPEVRLKWVTLIGHIPERLDPDDEHKMHFILIGLADPVQDICLEAIAQIEFLTHDRSKLAILLKIIDSKSPLIRSKAARTIIATLADDSRKLIESRAGLSGTAKKNGTKPARSDAGTGGAFASGKKNDEALAHETAELPGDAESGIGTRSEPAVIADTIPTGTRSVESRQSAGEIAKDAAAASQAGMGADAIKTDKTPAFSETEKAELTEIVEELDLPDEALTELERENTPASLLIKEIAPVKPVPHADNYFLRHSAVLHIKNIHEEELRFELYQTVLKHDPKDLVRQIAVEEARNLKREHVRPILSLGLEDPAWQVRSDALEYLLPFLSGTDEERQILDNCVKDSDYHIRQKADEKLLTIARRSATT